MIEYRFESAEQPMLSENEIALNAYRADKAARDQAQRETDAALVRLGNAHGHRADAISGKPDTRADAREAAWAENLAYLSNAYKGGGQGQQQPPPSGGGAADVEAAYREMKASIANAWRGGR